MPSSNYVKGRRRMSNIDVMSHSQTVQHSGPYKVLYRKKKENCGSTDVHLSLMMFASEAMIVEII